MNAKDLINALDAFEQEKGISKVVVLEALKEALEKAYKKHTDPDVMCRADIDGDAGTIEMYELKNVVNEVEDDLFEIELDDAKEIKADIKEIFIHHIYTLLQDFYRQLYICVFTTLVYLILCKILLLFLKLQFFIYIRYFPRLVQGELIWQKKK